jgi:hypothetical protein
MEVSCQCQTPVDLFPVKESPVPVGYVTEWVPESVWMPGFESRSFGPYSSPLILNLFVRVPQDAISLQICTLKVVFKKSCLVRCFRLPPGGVDVPQVADHWSSRCKEVKLFQ